MTTGVIHRGDALDCLRSMPDESVQCCVTSPPYWGLRYYGVKGQLGLEDSPEAYVAKMVEVFREVRRILKADGTLWLNVGDTYIKSGVCGGGSPVDKRKPEYGRIGYEKDRTLGRAHDAAAQRLMKKGPPIGYKVKDLAGIPWRLAFALQSDGWRLRQDIVWHKPSPMPEPVRDRCTKSHEYLFLMSKSHKYRFDHIAIMEPAVGRPSGNTRRKQRPSSEVLGAGQQAGSVPWAGGEMRFKRSVWTIPSQPCKEAHFAVMPEKLVEPCVLAGCPEGGVVLDPFMGSGTVGLVAARLGRKYIGIELKEEYARIAESRIAKAMEDSE